MPHSPTPTTRSVRPFRRLPWAGASMAALLLTVGCASTPMPTQEMAVASAAVARADNTTTSEAAPAELRTAVMKLASAQSAMAAGDAVRARRLAEQAVVDAELAELTAQAVMARRSAEEVESAARALRDEINRQTPR
jgi:hypothetical protein